MSALDSRAEILKLAALLRLKSARLAFLQPLPAARIRHLHERLDDLLHDEAAARLRHLVTLAQLLPPPLAALAGRRICGPLLCAELAGQMRPTRALAVAQHLDDGFLAEVAPGLDPRRSRELYAGLPPERAARIAALLLARGELAVLARMTESLGSVALAAVLAQVRDDDALLSLLYLLAPEGRAGRILDLLTPQRLQQLVLVPAAGAAELWPQSLWLLSFVDDTRRRLLGDVVAAQDDGVLDGMIDAVQQAQLWPAALPVLSGFGEAAQRRLLGRPAMRGPAVLGELIESAGQYGRWPEFAGLLRLGGEPLQRAATAALAGVNQAVMLGLLKAAIRNPLAAPLLPLLLRPDPAALQLLAKAAAALPASLALELEKQLLAAGAGQALATVRSTLLGKS
jgi:hypothetical protein